MKPLKIFIGYDAVESIAWHTLVHSIIQRTSAPVSFIPVKRSHLRDVHDRPIHPKQSNEFSFTRFLVPYLSNYEGWSLFIDCDMAVLDDIDKLFALCDDQYAAMCVQHNYAPSTETKYLGTIQHPYEKKNWSSVILFNNEKCRALTPAYVNTATGLQLHQFKWLEGDHQIGDISPDWNHLVGEYMPNPRAKLVHWTIGGPWFYEYEQTEFSEEWFKERANMAHTEQRE